MQGHQCEISAENFFQNFSETPERWETSVFPLLRFCLHQPKVLYDFLMYSSYFFLKKTGNQYQSVSVSKLLIAVEQLEALKIAISKINWKDTLKANAKESETK